jgi:two-component system, LytTR family, sensor histidine kinase AlgZ
MPLALQTLRALAAPRRALPLTVVGLAMLSAEWLATHSPSAMAIDAVLLLAFCLIGPASWRMLAAPSRPSKLASVAGYAGFLALNAAVVGALGYLVPSSLGLAWTYVVEPPSLGVVLVLFTVGGWGLGRDIELEEGITAAQLRAERLAVETEHAQLIALRTHLDPHFLFNTLNAIAEWCREDPAVAEAATLKLAALLRTILAGIRNPTWPLADELSLLQRLFELYQVRDDQRYRLVLELPSTLPNIELPTMILLPLFENAITHGPGAGHAGEVRLSLTVSGDPVSDVVIAIRNPGKFTGKREGGEGIDIAERRLALTYEGAARLSIRADGEATQTVVSIPMQTKEESAP